MLLTLFFGDAVERDDLRQWIAKHRERHAQRLAQYRTMKPQVKASAPFPALTLDFGIDYETAVLRWFDGLTIPKR